MAPSLGRAWIDWASRRVTESAASLTRGFLNRGAARAAEDANPRVYFVGRTQAGVYVDPDRALRQAAVWACVTYLSRTVAQLPWHVMAERRDGGGADRAITHPVDWLLNVRPNPEMGSFTFRQTMMGHALRYGNAYAEIERDLRGVPVALWVLHPTRVQVLRDESGDLVYRVSNRDDEPVDLVPGDVFHIRGFGDGPVGVNVIEYAAQSIGWAQATELFGASYFGEGMNPTGVVETESELSPEGMTQLRKYFAELYKGPKASRTVFLDAKMKWHKISSTPDESQFVDTRQHQVEEICRWFGVPPHKVQHLLRSTFSNIESQNIEVVVDSVVPWVRVFEDEAIYKLFGQNRLGLFTKMKLEGLLRGDTAARAKFYREMWGMGAYSVNDVLRLEDQNPIGPTGDARFVPVNFQTLDNALKAPSAKVKDALPEQAPDDQVEEPEDGADEATQATARRARRLNGRANGRDHAAH